MGDWVWEGSQTAPAVRSVRWRFVEMDLWEHIWLFCCHVTSLCFTLHSSSGRPPRHFHS